MLEAPRVERMHPETSGCVGARCLRQNSEGPVGAMWFGPRLGRRRRSDNKFTPKKIEALSEMLGSPTWNIVTIPGKRVYYITLHLCIDVKFRHSNPIIYIIYRFQQNRWRGQAPGDDVHAASWSWAWKCHLGVRPGTRSGQQCRRSERQGSGSASTAANVPAQAWTRSSHTETRAGAAQLAAKASGAVGLSSMRFQRRRRYSEKSGFFLLPFISIYINIFDILYVVCGSKFTRVSSKSIFDETAIY